MKGFVAFLIGLASIGGAIGLALGTDSVALHVLAIGPGIAGGMCIAMAMEAWSLV